MNNYKETLFFVGKCLTITHEKYNCDLVEQELKSNTVNWDNVVKLTTSHYVFPALYCNLKRANLLHYLPEDLIGYMKHITDLNRDRNLKILKQTKEINQLLLANNITPIFLKGTGNLLEGLYEDIGERMIGDIDFLVSKNNFKKTIQILENDGYQKKENLIDASSFHRHYPKISKRGKIAAAEIHYRMVSSKYNKYFNYAYVKKTLKTLKTNFLVLSYSNNILMTAFNKQFNDNGLVYNSISLRNSYDLFLLSKKESPLNALSNFNEFFKELNYFLIISNFIFNKPTSIDYLDNKTSRNYLNKSLFLIDNPRREKLRRLTFDVINKYKHILIVLSKSFYNEKYRTYLSKRLKYLFSKSNS
ncbi:nucleotidyltransferase family protein [Tenacibaculum ovolyticum]|uniref:nucleotidyltransferase domain-containing protein n=1 Tax=Tenacibaculum ovolyticum TaxID=104270 RepID=UPI0022F3E2C4|nr:nucleotidyltransferase family protein [Tenacibaculum ovolyticum]WBX77497.1 nucleotidyltransferase family protein [Tenacibaculum ovolyticum]